MFLPAWPGASPAFLGRPSACLHGLGGPRGCPPTGRTGSGRLGAACMLRFGMRFGVRFGADLMREKAEFAQI